MSADPTPAPPPEWAISMAIKHANEYYDGMNAYTLARLLASVREGALRDAVNRLGNLDVVLPDCSEERRDTADKCQAAILSLLSTPPVPPREGV